MIFAIGLALIAACLVFVAWPFFGSTSPEVLADPHSPAADRTAAMEKQKVEAYSAIKEAEFDYRMGKLTDADYTSLREKYASRAIEAIAAMEEAKTESRNEAEAPRAKAVVSAAGRFRRVAYCPQCGASLPAQASFCPACGRSLRELRDAVA